MKNVLLFLLLAVVISCSPKIDQSIQNFEVFRGTNLAHWLSQSDARAEREQFITRADIQAIAEMGFDHIRLPVDEEQMWDENGDRHDDAFNLMQNCIDWCAEENLRVIVDLHNAFPSFQCRRETFVDRSGRTGKVL